MAAEEWHKRNDRREPCIVRDDFVREGAALAL
jgi:hypothetical protein